MVAVFLFTFIFGVHIYKITIPIIGLTPAELSEMGIHCKYAIYTLKM